MYILKLAFTIPVGNEVKPMTTTRKRLISLLLTFVMIFSLLPAPAFAEGSQGARVVAMARAFKPKLAAMFAAARAISAGSPA